jgi:hypothetical protein
VIAPAARDLPWDAGTSIVNRPSDLVAHRNQGPFVIRAKRLDKSGAIRLGGSGQLPATAVPIIVPPVPTLNS